MGSSLRRIRFGNSGEWAADAPMTVPARLGVTGRPPSESTIRRPLQHLDGDGLDTAPGAWMWLRSRTIHVRHSRRRLAGQPDSPVIRASHCAGPG